MPLKYYLLSIYMLFIIIFVLLYCCILGYLSWLLSHSHGLDSNPWQILCDEQNYVNILVGKMWAYKTTFVKSWNCNKLHII